MFVFNFAFEKTKQATNSFWALEGENEPLSLRSRRSRRAETDTTDTVAERARRILNGDDELPSREDLYRDPVASLRKMEVHGDKLMNGMKHMSKNKVTAEEDALANYAVDLALGTASKSPQGFDNLLDQVEAEDVGSAYDTTMGTKLVVQPFALKKASTTSKDMDALYSDLAFENTDDYLDSNSFYKTAAPSKGGKQFEETAYNAPVFSQGGSFDSDMSQDGSFEFSEKANRLKPYLNNFKAKNDLSAERIQRVENFDLLGAKSNFDLLGALDASESADSDDVMTVKYNEGHAQSPFHRDTSMHANHMTKVDMSKFISDPNTRVMEVDPGNFNPTHVMAMPEKDPLAPPPQRQHQQQQYQPRFPAATNNAFADMPNFDDGPSYASYDSSSSSASGEDLRNVDIRPHQFSQLKQPRDVPYATGKGPRVALNNDGQEDMLADTSLPSNVVDQSFSEASQASQASQDENDFASSASAQPIYGGASSPHSNAAAPKPAFVSHPSSSPSDEKMYMTNENGVEEEVVTVSTSTDLRTSSPKLSSRVSSSPVADDLSHNHHADHNFAGVAASHMHGSEDYSKHSSSTDTCAKAVWRTASEVAFPNGEHPEHHYGGHVASKNDKLFVSFASKTVTKLDNDGNFNWNHLTNHRILSPFAFSDDDLNLLYTTSANTNAMCTSTDNSNQEFGVCMKGYSALGTAKGKKKWSVADSVQRFYASPPWQIKATETTSGQIWTVEYTSTNSGEIVENSSKQKAFLRRRHQDTGAMVTTNDITVDAKKVNLFALADNGQSLYAVAYDTSVEEADSKDAQLAADLQENAAHATGSTACGSECVPLQRYTLDGTFAKDSGYHFKEIHSPPLEAKDGKSFFIVATPAGYLEASSLAESVATPLLQVDLTSGTASQIASLTADATYGRPLKWDVDGKHFFVPTTTGVYKIDPEGGSTWYFNTACLAGQSPENKSPTALDDSQNLATETTKKRTHGHAASGAATTHAHGHAASGAATTHHESTHHEFNNRIAQSESEEENWWEAAENDSPKLARRMQQRQGTSQHNQIDAGDSRHHRHIHRSGDKKLSKLNQVYDQGSDPNKDPEFNFPMEEDIKASKKKSAHFTKSKKKQSQLRMNNRNNYPARSHRDESSLETGSGSESFAHSDEYLHANVTESQYISYGDERDRQLDSLFAESFDDEEEDMDADAPTSFLQTGETNFPSLVHNHNSFVYFLKTFSNIFHVLKGGRTRKWFSRV